MIQSIADAQRVSERLERERRIFLDPATFVLDGREELDSEHEGGILAEYGYDALVRYYCPTDPRLSADARLP